MIKLCNYTHEIDFNHKEIGNNCCELRFLWFTTLMDAAAFQAILHRITEAAQSGRK